MYFNTPWASIARKFSIGLIAVCVATLFGCSGGGSGGGGGGGGGGGTGSGGSAVSESLESLGVDTEETPRVDESGETLPDTYTPLGSSAEGDQSDELFVIGPELQVDTPTGTEILEDRALFAELSDDDTKRVGLNITEVVTNRGLYEYDSRRLPPSGHGVYITDSRDACAADIDRDGLDEILVVYYLRDEGTGQVYLEIRDKDENGETTVDTQILATRDVLRSVSCAAGDLDGDGYDELVVSISNSESAELLVFDREGNGDFEAQPAAAATFDRRLAGGTTIAVLLRVGNIDRDRGEEIVAVVNELGSSNSARSAYWVYDDAGSDYAELVMDGAIEDSERRAAVIGNAALGDIDGDGIDEIVLGGVEHIITKDCDSTPHVLLTLEDAAHSTDPLSVTSAHYYRFNYIPSGTGCNSNSHQMRVNFVHLNTLDIDGDGAAEIQANLQVFEDFVDAEPWTIAYEMPEEVMLTDLRNGGSVGRWTTAFAVGDINGDSRQEIFTFCQWNDKIDIWGLEGPSLETAEFKSMLEIPTQRYNAQSRVFPILVPCNVDKDGIALKYSDAEHRFIFTQPIVVAAIAAPPCDGSLGQDSAACRAIFGQTNTEVVGIDGNISVRAAVSVGAEAKVFGVGAKFKKTITKTATFSAGRSYELEQSIEYETGGSEDTVVVTTIPVDQYIYTVVAHPDPDMVGEEVVVNLPREPVTIQVEREYYNANSPDGAMKIDADVFSHSPGVLSSYPTEEEADVIMQTGGVGRLGPLGKVVDAAGNAIDNDILDALLGKGIKGERVTVGIGNEGVTRATVKFTESTDYRAGYEVDYEVEAETTAGATFGVAVGGSVGAGISWGGSDATMYSGSVSTIPAANASGQYSMGLFTYVFNYGDRSKQQFEVINFWVDQ